MPLWVIGRGVRSTSNAGLSDAKILLISSSSNAKVTEELVGEPILSKTDLFSIVRFRPNSKFWRAASSYRVNLVGDVVYGMVCALKKRVLRAVSGDGNGMLVMVVLLSSVYGLWASIQRLI